MVDTVIAFLPLMDMDTTRPPLAPALLKGILEEAGIECKTYDFNAHYHQAITGTDFEKISASIYSPELKLDLHLFEVYHKFISHCVDTILENKPSNVLLSVFTHQSTRVTEDICYQLRMQAPNVYILLGGSGVSIRLEQYNNEWCNIVLENQLCDAVLLGEAEDVIVDLVKNKPVGIQKTTQLPNDILNDLPAPNFDDYDFDHYGGVNQIIIPVTASKGCVRKCSFCDIARFWPKFRYRRGENVANELITIYNKYGIKNFTFTDSLINGALKPLREMNTVLSETIADTIQYRGQAICRSQKDMPPRDFELMRSGGCERINIGIESGSESVRDHMKKMYTNDDIYYTAEQCLKNNIKQIWNIISGYPTETDKDWEDTINLVKRYADHSDMIKIMPNGVFQMLQGTPITTDRMLNELQIDYHSVDGYKEYHWVSVLYPNNTLKVRAERYFELVELLLELDMLEERPQKIKQKIEILKNQVEYFNAREQNSNLIPIQQQLPDESDRFFEV